MPLEIWNHLFHPFTYNAVDGKQEEFSPEEISRVKHIASGSIVVGALGAYSSSKSIKFSIITIGLTALVIFYIAAAIFKMRNRENPDPKQSAPPNPATLESNQKKEQETHSGQPNKDREDAPGDDSISAKEAPSTPAASSQLIIPSVPQATSSMREEPILHVQVLPPQPVPSPQPLVSSGSATSSSLDSASLDKHNETNGAEVVKEEPRKSDRTSAEKDLKKEKRELVAQKLPFSKPQEPVPLSPQLSAPGETSRVDTGKKDQKKINKQSITASPLPSVQVPKQKLYLDLPLTEVEAKIIHQIIETIGSTSVFSLPFETPRLIELGDKIQHVHPLKFLEKVLNTPELKESMIEVEKGTIKWKGFLWGNKLDRSAGFEAKCNRETAQNNFAIYIDDFCKAVKAPVDKVRPFVTDKNWAGMVQFLIKQK